MKKIFTLIFLFVSIFCYSQIGLPTKLVAGTNITLDQSGNTYTVNASGGGGGTVTSVNAGTNITITGTSTPTVTAIPNPTFSTSVTSPIGTFSTSITSPIATHSTSVTSPLIIGGSSTTQTLTYQTTTGVGTTGANHIWKVGNNGATTAMTLLNSGFLGIGTSSPQQQLQLTGCFRMPTTNTTTIGVYYSGGNRFIHNAGTQNFFAGVNAGSITGLSGQGFNVGVGSLALNVLTSGELNTAIGASCLSSVTTSSNNTGVGADCLAGCIGESNTAVGSDAMNGFGGTVSGCCNVAVGVGCLGSITTGSYNIGLNGAGILTTGSRNMIFGGGSLLTTGNNNLAIGLSSLASIDSDSSNIAIGYQAGKYETGSNSFYINNQDRTNLSGDKSNSLMSGLMGSTPSVQTLQINASLGVNTSVGAGSGVVIKGFGSSDATYAWQVQSSTGTATFSVRNDGQIATTTTVNATAGDAATMNVARGRFRKDSSGSIFTLTNSLITANSIIITTFASDPGATGYDSPVIAAGVGSAVITFKTAGIAGAPANDTDINFFVDN